MFTNSPPLNSTRFTSGWDATRAPQRDRKMPRERRFPIGGRSEEHTDALRFHSFREHAATAWRPTVDIAPSETARRRRVTWHGMTAELVKAMTHDRIECRFNAPVHLLVVYERGLRRAGETFVQGAPRSSLRDFAGKLTFVPAGHEYREWQEPRIRPQVLYVFFDVRELQDHSGVETTDLVPRVFFGNSAMGYGGAGRDHDREPYIGRSTLNRSARCSPRPRSYQPWSSGWSRPISRNISPNKFR